MRRSQQGTPGGVLALVGLLATGQPDAATHCALGLAEAAWPGAADWMTSRTRL
jgi:hypothetical protein